MFILPKLPYDYGALEPFFDEATMRLHHQKHHQGYVDKLNAALEPHPELAEKTLEDLLGDLEALPEAVRVAVRNQGGGHWNHSFYWPILAPATRAGQPSDKLREVLVACFGSLDYFERRFKEKALSVFGSGWIWLVLTQAGQLEILATANQDSPLGQKEKVLLGVDVWEHAYYLKYQNRRADYLDAFFKIVNWPRVSALLES